MQKSAKTRRRIAVIRGLVALMTCSLPACAPAPAPTPSPTPAFASEEAAFAAAEEVYRAYFEALGARIRGESEPDPQVFLGGVALENDIDAQNSLLESGLVAIGEPVLTSFLGKETAINGQIAGVTAHVCIDVSNLRVRDSSGLDVTPSDRGDVVAQLVQFSGDDERLLITRETSTEEASC